MRVHVLDVNEAIGKVCKLLYRLMRENVSLNISFGPELPSIKADAGMIEQALVNLVLNARDAIGPDGGKIQIDTLPVEANAEFCMEHAEAKPGRYACIRVADTGCGIDPAHLEHIFEPFFTTKESGKNSGLGLATVYGILKQHSGWVNVQSERDHGATFLLYFPATLDEAPKAPAANAAAKENRGHETILLVEDDEALRRTAKTILSKAGYRVIEASDGPHALFLWQNCGENIDLLLSDLVMPKGVSGKQLADQLRAAKPGLKAVYMSGYTMELNEEDLALDTNTRFLPKPFQPDKVVRFIRECLDNVEETQA
jgi:CheY-like chemotaxis protein